LHCSDTSAASSIYVMLTSKMTRGVVATHLLCLQDLSTLSLEDLEAELARRRNAASP
jgi:hypothetical protein